MRLVGIDGIASALDQGRTLISNCADAVVAITSLLAKLPAISNSEEKNV